jgi:hypothetical protein
MEPIEIKVRGKLRSIGGESLSVTLPIDMVRDMKLAADQPVVIENREVGDVYGIFIVPIRTGPND